MLSSFSDLLISKTVEIALEKEIIKSKSIIVEATHTKARYNFLRADILVGEPKNILAP
jgi:hypothetical protein